MPLQQTIESLYAQGERADKAAARDAFFTLQRGLGRGEIRAAERDSSTPASSPGFFNGIVSLS